MRILYWVIMPRARIIFLLALSDSGSSRLDPVEHEALKREALMRLRKETESRTLQLRRKSAVGKGSAGVQGVSPPRGELDPGTLGTVDMRCDGIDASTEKMKAASQTDECCCRVKVDCGSSRCIAARAIRRACSAINCTGYEFNKERTWATLKVGAAATAAAVAAAEGGCCNRC